MRAVDITGMLVVVVVVATCVGCTALVKSGFSALVSGETSEL